MEWIDQFQLFLFDFDGVLVDTEPLHFAAYKKMCEDRGVAWRWDFARFCVESHGKAQGLKDGLYRESPELYQQEPNWDVLTQEKRKIYVELLESYHLELMPGVAPLLEHLSQKGVKSCVVTNSPRDHIEIIKTRLPELYKIPFWLAREDYVNPKPAPDGYLKAIALHSKQGDAVIGFEDTLKGLKALMQAQAKAVLLCSATSAHVAECVNLGAYHFESFNSIYSFHWKVR